MPYVCTHALVTSAKWGCGHRRCEATFGSFLSGLYTPLLSVLLLETTTLWSLRGIFFQGPSILVSRARLLISSPNSRKEHHGGRGGILFSLELCSRLQE